MMMLMEDHVWTNPIPGPERKEREREREYLEGYKRRVGLGTEPDIPSVLGCVRSIG
jgi:hypothetical protein